eukprot:TRINITY_DN6861_c1_g4_i2.p2 TRINITY_DN6861_c1_g4~~TRINITY_DN6861_c1_g4_i2.p2  ORF type:complete len:138 (-),score=36.22 TRINITY_DN6861_c1_g4_i2:73-486(-)
MAIQNRLRSRRAARAKLVTTEGFGPSGGLRSTRVEAGWAAAWLQFRGQTQTAKDCGIYGGCGHAEPQPSGAKEAEEEWQQQQQQQWKQQRQQKQKQQQKQQLWVLEQSLRAIRVAVVQCSPAWNGRPRRQGGGQSRS